MKKLILINIVLILLFNVLPSTDLEKKENNKELEIQKVEQILEITSRSLEEPRIVKNVTEERQFCQKATSYSENCINLIKKYEGCKLEAYRLSGEVYWTIGYGHHGSEVKEGQVITEEVAERLLIADVQGVCDYVLKKVDRLQLNQNELDALISFTYNCGIGNFNKLTKGRTKEEIANHIEAYNNGGMKGLILRRAEEKELYTKEV